MNNKVTSQVYLLQFHLLTIHFFLRSSKCLLFRILSSNLTACKSPIIKKARWFIVRKFHQWLPKACQHFQLSILSLLHITHTTPKELQMLEGIVRFVPFIRFLFMLENVKTYWPFLFMIWLLSICNKIKLQKITKFYII